MSIVAVQEPECSPNTLIDLDFKLGLCVSIDSIVPIWDEPNQLLPNCADVLLLQMLIRGPLEPVYGRIVGFRGGTEEAAGGSRGSSPMAIQAGISIVLAGLILSPRKLRHWIV